MSKENEDNISQKPAVIVGVLAAILFISVYTFINKYAYNWKDNPNANVGAYGDALNGLSAPFIALLSAFLIFYSFREQIKANRLQYRANLMLESQWKFDTYLSLFREIENEFNNMEVILKNTSNYPNSRTTTFKGGEAVFTAIQYSFNSEFVSGDMQTLRLLTEVSDEFVFLLQELGKTTFTQKHYLAYKILRFYNKNYQGVSDALKQHIRVKTPETDLTLLTLANLNAAIFKFEKEINEELGK